MVHYSQVYSSPSYYNP